MAAKHILVVDDEIGIRELLRDILQDEGYRVQLAENAAAARAVRLQERPDLVLLDIWMPDCDGITLLKEWVNSSLLTMPVVMMSGHGTIDTAVEATRIGAFDFLENYEFRSCLFLVFLLPAHLLILAVAESTEKALPGLDQRRRRGLLRRLLGGR
jgi:FixJ family two-component response regulator